MLWTVRCGCVFSPFVFVQAKHCLCFSCQVGYRGLNDYPFWNDDPRFNTPAKRGALISQAMQLQVELIKNATAAAAARRHEEVGAPKQWLLEEASRVPDIFTYLWDEAEDLYAQGFLKVTSHQKQLSIFVLILHLIPDAGPRGRLACPRRRWKWDRNLTPCPHLQGQWDLLSRHDGECWQPQPADRNVPSCPTTAVPSCLCHNSASVLFAFCAANMCRTPTTTFPLVSA